MSQHHFRSSDPEREVPPEDPAIGAEPGITRPVPAGPAAGLGEIQPGYRFEGVHRFDPAQASAFARAAGDLNPLHHDPDAALASPYGKLLASATQTNALLMGLVATHFSARGNVVGVKFGFELLRPVFADQRVTLSWEVSGVAAHRRKGHYVDLAGAMAGPDGAILVQGHGRILVW